MSEKNALSEADKNRIRLEELFRHEIQQQLLRRHEREEKKRQNGYRSRWEEFSTFINSAFFLWFLSTIVLGVISFSFTTWQKQREEERREYEQEKAIERDVKKLDAEISSRLSYVNSLILAQDPLLIEPTNVVGFLALERPTEAKYPVNVFPEFSNRTLRSLLWELSRSVPEYEKFQIDDALTEAKKLSAIYMKQQPDNKFQVENWKKYKAQMAAQGKEEMGFALSYSSSPLDLKALNLERWGSPLTCLDVEKKMIERPIDK